MRLTTLLLILLPLYASGCTLSMNYQQCSQDSDCAMLNGAAQFCTSDQICVPNTPEERLCQWQIRGTYSKDKPLPALSSSATHVGALLDLGKTSADNQYPADMHYRALQLAVQAINDAVQLDGVSQIVVDVCNVGNSPIDADNAAKILIEQKKVVALIGPNTPEAAPLVITRVKAAGVPTISPEIISSKIADSATQGLFFLLAPVEREQGRVLVTQFTTLLGSKTSSPYQVGLVSVTNDYAEYGENVRSKFLADWGAKYPGPAMITNQFYRYKNSMELTTVTGQLLTNQPNFVILIPATDSLDAITGLSGLLANPAALGAFDSTTQLLVSSTGRTGGLINLLRNASPTLTNHLARITGVAPLTKSSGDEGRDFEIAWKAQNPDLPLEQNYMVSYTYDAMMVIGAASASTKGAQRPDQILAVLRQLTGSAKLPSIKAASFKATVQTLAQNPNEVYSLTGVTGPIRFTATGGRDPALLETWKIDVDAGTYTNTPIP